MSWWRQELVRPHRPLHRRLPDTRCTQCSGEAVAEASTARQATCIFCSVVKEHPLSKECPPPTLVSVSCTLTINLLPKKTSCQVQLLTLETTLAFLNRGCAEALAQRLIHYKPNSKNGNSDQNQSNRKWLSKHWHLLWRIIFARVQIFYYCRNAQACIAENRTIEATFSYAYATPEWWHQW